MFTLLRSIQFGILLFVLSFSTAFGMNRAQGWCEQGNKSVIVGGLSSVLKPVQGSFPGCTVTVYVTGGGLASIYSTNTGTSLSNPFTADTTGYWAFYALDGNYDVQFSGGGIPTPFTQGSKGVIDPYFISSVGGYVPRTKNAKLSDVISVKDLGAVGDGVADDTAAVVQAVTNSTLINCIFFPDGVYNISTAITTTHKVCLTGNSWRLKYTNSPTITYMFSIIGDPSQNRSTFLEGSYIRGMILDGQGHATNGLNIQGVVGPQMEFIRVTNVTGTGVICQWCQQAKFEFLTVSNNYETFTTTPTTGLSIIGPMSSSANMFSNIDIEHVSGDGIYLQYSLNGLFYGGTSEGNGGYGVNCTGSDTPYYQCLQNAFVQIDTEVNTAGDYLFGQDSYFNTVTNANSFSNPGVTFSGNSHANTIIGGSIGTGSKAGASTWGNRLINVSTTALTGTPWVDSGQNHADTIYNNYNGTYTDEINNYNKTFSLHYSPGSRGIQFNTPYPGSIANLVVGNNTNYIGFYTEDGFTSGWLQYPVSGAGLQFMSTTAPNTGAVSDGQVVNHKWCIGRFCPGGPLFTLHMNDSVTNTMAIQAGSGQGGADLLKFLKTDGTLLGAFTYDGKLNTPIIGGAIGQALCKKADSTIGYCSTVVSGSGACTCN